MSDSISQTESTQKRLRDFNLSPESQELQDALIKILKQPEGSNPSQKRVVVQFFINRIFKVDDVAQSVNLDFYLKVNWIDEKYIGVSDDDFQDDENKFGDGWWEPGVEVSNAIELEKMIEKDEAFWIEFPAFGIIAYTQRFIGSISSPMDLHAFPFDSQLVPIIFESFHWKLEDMIMFRLSKHKYQSNPGPGKEWLTMSKSISLPEWHVQAIQCKEQNNHYAFEDRTYSQIQIEIQLKRDYSYYMWKVFAMVILIIFMSWIVFVMDPEELPDRTGITVTLFLAAVAFNFVIGGTLPRISYNTLLDNYLLVSYVFIVGTLIQNAVVFLIWRYHDSAEDVDEESEIAKTIDWISLGVFPLLWFAYTGIFLLSAISKYNKHALQEVGEVVVIPQDMRHQNNLRPRVESSANRIEMITVKT